MPNSLVTSFGPILVQQDWSCLEAGLSADEMAEAFQEAASGLVDSHFPKKTITVTEGDKPYFTDELKKLRRKRDSIYQKSGKNYKYDEAQQKFQAKLKAEALKYKNKIISEVQEGKRGSGYSAIRSLGEGPA